MQDLVKMGVVLTIVGAVCTACLAFVEQNTREPIAAAKRLETLNSLKKVLPEGFDNQPDADTVLLTSKLLNAKGSPVTFYRARKGGKATATAFTVTAPDGYSGNIEIMMAVAPGGVLTGVMVVSQKETPGLGDKYLGKWLDFFKGKNRDNVKWGVKKDGGEFDHASGATVTPRAIVKAVKRGLDYLVEHEAEVFAPATPAQPVKTGG